MNGPSKFYSYRSGVRRWSYCRRQNTTAVQYQIQRHLKKLQFFLAHNVYLNQWAIKSKSPCIHSWKAHLPILISGQRPTVSNMLISSIRKDLKDRQGAVCRDPRWCYASNELQWWYQTTMGCLMHLLGAQGNEQSGRAIIARQTGATQAFHFIDGLSRAIRHLGRIVCRSHTLRFTRVSALSGCWVLIIRANKRSAKKAWARFHNRFDGEGFQYNPHFMIYLWVNMTLR